MRLPRSLHVRLLLGIFFCLALILSAGSYLSYRAIRQYLWAEMDAALRDRARFFQSVISTDGQGLPKFAFPKFELLENEWAQITKPHSRDHAEFWWARTGRFINRTTSLDGQDLPRPELKEGEYAYETVTLADGVQVRALSTVFRLRSNDPNEVPSPIQTTVARDSSGMEETLEGVRGFLYRMGFGATSLLMIASLLIVRRSLKPVSSLAAQVDAVPLTDSDHQFVLRNAPSEIQPLIDRLNALMRRVTAAIEHERRFTSNAAHELRNPLAAIRSSIELSLTRQRTVDDYIKTLESVLESQTGLQRVVDNLLMLARLETGHQGTEFIREPVSLTKLMRRAWRNAFDTAERRKINPVWDIDRSDREYPMAVSLVEIVVRNLFENAAAYAPENTSILITAAVRNSSFELSVTNKNPGLHPQDLDRTFAPFWRSNPNASGHHGNAGIGLALSRRIMISLGGSLDANLQLDTITYSLKLPVSKPVSPAIRTVRERNPRGSADPVERTDPSAGSGAGAGSEAADKAGSRADSDGSRSGARTEEAAFDHSI